MEVGAGQTEALLVGSVEVEHWMVRRTPDNFAAGSRVGSKLGSRPR